MRSTSKVSSGGGPPRRRTLITFYTVLAALLIPAAIAWACNPQAHISLKCGTPQSCSTFEPGQSMTVYGSYFPSKASITVSGPSGTKPVSADTGGSFTTSYTAPSAPGTYVISASRPTGGRAPASFTVAEASQNTPAPGGNGPSQGGGSPTAGTPGAPSFDEPSVNSSPQERGSRGGGRNTPSVPNQPTGGGGSGGSTGETPGASIPGTVVTESGEPVFSGSVGSTPATSSFGGGASTPSDIPAASSGGSNGGAGASEQSATGDVWSGFSPGRTATLMGDVQGAPEGGKGSGFGLGIGLLAFGLLALAAGLTVAEVRRRKALAHQ